MIVWVEAKATSDRKLQSIREPFASIKIKSACEPERIGWYLPASQLWDFDNVQTLSLSLKSKLEDYYCTFHIIKMNLLIKPMKNISN